MNQAIIRMNELMAQKQTIDASIGIVIAEQLERIADALEKQSAGQTKPIGEMTLMISVDNEAASVDISNGLGVEDAILKNLKFT